jgi:hypothetical protein
MKTSLANERRVLLFFGLMSINPKNKSEFARMDVLTKPYLYGIFFDGPLR